MPNTRTLAGRVVIVTGSSKGIGRVEQVVRKTNVVRLGEPEDIANLPAFVLSPQSRYLQGALIDLDGGQTKTV